MSLHITTVFIQYTNLFIRDLTSDLLDVCINQEACNYSLHIRYHISFTLAVLTKDVLTEQQLNMLFPFRDNEVWILDFNASDM
ncbi:unnamed protein product [Orchesella dallaii]|uniref:Uncharacterized protein n=1 Tax=Orchesella dallaii TaxID=48710 RepID=A0ABP1R6D4_9HEXA